MSVERIKRTSIWKNTLEELPGDEFKIERDRLRGAFLKFRENTSYLVSRVAIALPGLTQHEISHLDALWETSSIIVGEKLELTPLEGFVLGSSFLLHDSALCFEAYEGGIEGVRNTKQWKDVFEDLNESNKKLSIDEIKNLADFNALRNLHAGQAERLLSHKWESDGNEVFLLEDVELRVHLGKIIGQIAASHHWDIETVVSSFNSQINAPGTYPRHWRIDPIKIAFILRCSDAAHIDNERAPDFLHVLLKRSGVSFDHWKAQNRLAKVDIDQSDPSGSTLLFTSTIEFQEFDSSAWFVAYDAICLVDKEIKSCNSYLKRLYNQSFKIECVKGADSPESLSKYVKAEGWQPCSAKVHIGNIESIIRNLGGEMLYGAGSDSLGIVLRETIQNSRDSIKARYVFDQDFEGKISVSLHRDTNATWIIIEDNGVGMSERVLTGPLLDFGTSFWTSSLVQSEFPGLRSSKFKSIGKFGIGFYSIFMIADEVYISSRNYNSGFNEICQLKFKEGFTLRPILSKRMPDNFTSSISTQIRIKLKEKTINEDLTIEMKSNKKGSLAFNVPLKAYLAALCGGLDVSVYYKESLNNEIKVHQDITSDFFDKELWLNQISFSDFQPNSTQLKEYISENISRIVPIDENNISFGMAALNIKNTNESQDFLNLRTVGGLASIVNGRGGDDFIGFIDYSAKSAKRELGQYFAPESTITKWAAEQLDMLLSMQLSNIERYFASNSLCNFKVDPIDFAQILVSQENKLQFFSFEELATLSLTKKIAFIKSGWANDHIETYHNISSIPNHILIKPLSNGTFLSLKQIKGIPENNFSILDCLYRAILKQNLIPNIIEVPKIGQNIFNDNMNAIIIKSTNPWS